MSELREIIAGNLIKLRKGNKLTQLDLAQKLNYSDKAISKWERADTIPDIETLKELADLYGVTVNDIIYENIPNNVAPKKKKFITNELIITLLSCLLVWFIAALVYVEIKLVHNFSYWQAFIWAIPVTAIVSLVFNSIWGYKPLQYVIISVLIWSLLLSIYLQWLSHNLWLLFILGIPGEIAVILSSGIKRRK